MEIVPYPHPALRWKSRPVTRIDVAMKRTVRRMFELMYEAKGVGLAANQVALPFRFFIINLSSDPELTEEELVFINPQIVHRTGSVEGEEGCLSVPQLYGQVTRAEQVVVDAFDLEGQGFQYELDELPGRVVQHETDHLDGVMFFDRMSDAGRKQLEPQLDEFETIFRHRQATGECLSDEALRGLLEELQEQSVPG